MNARGIESRVQRIDWEHVAGQLNTAGWALIEDLLTPEMCDTWSALYDRDDLFRKKVVMARHGYGQGEYKYFSYPLPETVTALRGSLYPHLAPIANDWYEKMRLEPRFPERHEDFIARCHAAGQTRPTPLMLRYGENDFNCLHQDLYGEHVFPLQVVFLLSEPGEDFTGGEFVLTEQRPRKQSRAEVVPLCKGSAAIFSVRHRPVQSTRGYARVSLRHGVSRIRSGSRTTAGIIFHDAS
jgi:hypothetical protein